MQRKYKFRNRAPMARNRNRRRQNAAGSQAGLGSNQGSVQTFTFALNPVSKSGIWSLEAATIPELKTRVDMAAEWKVVSATFTWNPLVGMGDHGTIMIAASNVGTLPADASRLALLGVRPRQTSTSQSAQIGQATEWSEQSSAGGGVTVYASSSGSTDLGFVSGRMTIRVRGLSSSS